MLVFAQEDLNRGINGSASSRSSSSTTSRTTTTVSVDSGVNNLGVDFINPQYVVASLNLFVLAWTIFYMIICLAHFFNQRVFNSGGEISGEKNGMRGIYKAFKVAWSYVFTLPFFIGFAFANTNYPEFSLFAGVLMILVYILKIIFDLKTFLHLFDYFPWESKFANNLISLLTIKK
jgi:Ca2+/H+ antiporter